MSDMILNISSSMNNLKELGQAMSLASAMHTTNVSANLQGGLITNQPFRQGGGGRNGEFNGRSKPPQCFVCDGWHFARECPLIAKAKVQMDGAGTAAPAPVTSELTSVLSQLKEVFADLSSTAKELKKPHVFCAFGPLRVLQERDPHLSRLGEADSGSCTRVLSIRVHVHSGPFLEHASCRG